MKNELDGKIIKNFIGYGSEDKKAKDAKKKKTV